MVSLPLTFFFFFFNDTATTEIYTLSLHDALPISFMFIRSWLLTVCGDFPQTGRQVSMRRMSLAAVSLLKQVRTVVAFLLVIPIALLPYVVRALPLPNARGPLDRKLFAINVLLRRNCGVNLLDCTTTRFVLWIDAPLDEIGGAHV